MRQSLVFAALLLAAAASAAELPTLGSTPFSMPSLKDLRAAAAAQPELSPRAAADPASGSVAQFPLAGDYTLLGYADTQAEEQAAVASWTKILANAGLTPGQPTWDGSSYTIPYTSPDGRLLRRFSADPREFAPKDPAALQADEALVSAALAKAGLKVVAALDENIDGMLPTYDLYYLTLPDADHDRESQVRVLSNGDDIDYDILDQAGIDIVSKPKSWLAVYVGPAVSFVSLLSDTQDDAQQRLDTRVQWLQSQGAKIIGSRITEDPSAPAEYSYVARVYFFLP